MVSAIYAIVNQATRDMYVGSAVAVNRRWSAHQSQLRKNKHHCKHLQNAHIKYGEKAFDWEIIEFVDDVNKLIEKEQFWINFFRPTYNKRAIADSCLGLKRSKESRLKMSVAQTGKKQSEATKAKRSALLKGRPRPLAVREKISASHIGIVPNEASRAKMSESAKRRKRK
jgi:group I intron endonuclease